MSFTSVVMQCSICWRDLFLDAYKYSSNYLLFAIVVAIGSIFCSWLYEKPQFYKLICIMTKHSNTEENCVQNLNATADQAKVTGTCSETREYSHAILLTNATEISESQNQLSNKHIGSHGVCVKEKLKIQQPDNYEMNLHEERFVRKF